MRQESGRSMVEMLGTLAIIGVLSVGSIAGYSYGMDKYQANTIVNDVMLRAVELKAQLDTTEAPNLDSWPTTTAGKYAIGLETGGEYINGIQVSGVDKRLCEMLFDGMINQATIKIGAIEYDSVADTADCGDTNTMVFYLDDGGSWIEETDTQTETQTDTETETTETTTETQTETKTETTHIPCSADKPYWNGTECVSCASIDASKPIWYGSECVSCARSNDSKPYWNGTECVSCASGDASKPYWDGTSCLSSCPTEKPYWNGTRCVTCASGDRSKPYWNGTECVSCASFDASKPIWTGWECVPCAYYYTEKPYWNGTECVSCASGDASKPYWDGTSCLSSCPTEKPYWNGTLCGSCTSTSCGNNKYCADYNLSSEQATPGKGCVDLDGTYKTVKIDGITYYISNNTKSWWDATSFCEALGKNMISHELLVQTCTSDDTDCSSSGTKHNALGAELYSHFGDKYIWSSIVKDSTNAYNVNLSDGSVGSYLREYPTDTPSGYALCK